MADKKHMNINAPTMGSGIVVKNAHRDPENEIAINIRAQQISEIFWKKVR